MLDSKNPKVLKTLAKTKSSSGRNREFNILTQKPILNVKIKILLNIKICSHTLFIYLFTFLLALRVKFDGMFKNSLFICFEKKINIFITRLF